MPLAYGKPPRRLYPDDLLVNHPLAFGLALFQFPGDSNINLVNGMVPLASTGYNAVATPYGPAASMTSAAANNIKVSAGEIITHGSTEFTIACLAAPTSVAARTNVFTQYDENSTNNQQLQFAMNSDNSGSASAGQFALYVYDAGNRTQMASNPGSGPDGNYHLFMCWTSRIGGSTTGNIFLDGVSVKQSITGTSPGPFSQTGPTMLCGSPNTQNRTANYPVTFVAVWNRALTDDQAESFSADPYQIFRIQQFSMNRFFLPAAGDTLWAQASL